MTAPTMTPVTAITLPDGIAETDTFIQQLDSCLMTGFTNLGAEQHGALQSLNRIFAGSPLGQPLEAAIEAVSAGSFLPEHFQVIASARVALLGAQYDHLRQSVRDLFGRTNDVDTITTDFTDPVPLQNSAAHWLMDIAISGFSRLELTTVTPFKATLSQLQSDADLMPLATLLTGFMQELIGAVPITKEADAPLFRWADLWSRALVMTLHLPQQATPTPVSGVLYPLGIDWRQHPFMTSLVTYGILETDTRMHLVRSTQSAYKVDAIGYDEQWLLFPDMAMIANSLEAGIAIVLDNIPILPSGDLIWDIDCATMGDKYKIADVAEQYFAPQSPDALSMAALPAHQRHPVHIAEPVFLPDIAVNDWTISSGDLTFELDKHRTLDTEMQASGLTGCTWAFGLLRYNAEAWLFQPLSAAKGKGKVVFMGKDSTKLFKKAPKSSTLSILQERASVLLRA